jgi:hypothetical protein
LNQNSQPQGIYEGGSNSDGSPGKQGGHSDTESHVNSRNEPNLSDESQGGGDDDTETEVSNNGHRSDFSEGDLRSENMAPIRSKPSIDGAVSICDWTPDQALVNNRVVSSVQIGLGAVNATGIMHQQTISANVHYFVAAHNVKRRGALVDRGANGGIAGDDTRVIHKHLRKVDVTGIDNHKMTDLQIVDTASWTMSNTKGPVILIFHQYAYHGSGRSIHSAIQLKQYKNRADDRSIKSGGRQ